MSTQIKSYRVKFYELAQLIKDLNSSGKNSVEIEQAYYSLVLARAWINKILGDLNCELTEDKGDKVSWIQQGSWAAKILGNNMTHADRVYYLKETIEMLTVDLIPLLNNQPGFQPYFPIDCFEQHITEVDMWLDLELKRIEDLELQVEEVKPRLKFTWKLFKL